MINNDDEQEDLDETSGSFFVDIYEGVPNAFATGPSKSNSLVAFSTGLLQGMNRKQVEALLAHEVAHIENGEMVTLTLTQGVVNTFVIFLARAVAYAVDSFLSKDDEESSGPRIGYWISSHPPLESRIAALQSPS